MMTMVLVQCGAAKRAKPSRAEDLYTGGLFKAARACARRIGDSWFILSAKYGLLAPTRIIAPYDQKLKSGGDREWSERVLVQLREYSAERYRIVVLAGADYCVGWADELGAEQPLKGLSGIGKRINFMKGIA